MNRWLFLLAGVLWALAAVRDGFDAWIDRTDLPGAAIETSAELFDRDGVLLRAFTTTDGTWRLHTVAADVDPTYIDLLTSHED